MQERPGLVVDRQRKVLMVMTERGLVWFISGLV